MDALSDDDPWTDIKSDVPHRVQLITGNYYDEKIVSRWTSSWLPEDNTTWVIGVTKPFPFMKEYEFGLVSKTIRILNDLYAQDDSIRFGLVDYRHDELLKEALLGLQVPTVVVLRNGLIIKDRPFRESYDKVH